MEVNSNEETKMLENEEISVPGNTVDDPTPWEDDFFKKIVAEGVQRQTQVEWELLQRDPILLYNNYWESLNAKYQSLTEEQRASWTLEHMLHSTLEVKQQYMLREERRRTSLLMSCFNTQDSHAPQVMKALERSWQLFPLYEAYPLSFDGARQIWKVCSEEGNSSSMSASNTTPATPIIERKLF